MDCRCYNPILPPCLWHLTLYSQCYFRGITLLIKNIGVSCVSCVRHWWLKRAERASSMHRLIPVSTLALYTHDRRWESIVPGPWYVVESVLPTCCFVLIKILSGFVDGTLPLIEAIGPGWGLHQGLSISSQPCLLGASGLGWSIVWPACNIVPNSPRRYINWLCLYLVPHEYQSAMLQYCDIK